MLSTVLVIDSMHRILSPLDAAIEQAGSDLMLQPLSWREYQDDAAFAAVLTQFPGAPLVLDLRPDIDAAWAVLLRLRQVDCCRHRPVLLTSPPGSYRLGLAGGVSDLRVPHPQQGLVPLLTALTAAWARVRCKGSGCQLPQVG